MYDTGQDSVQNLPKSTNEVQGGGDSFKTKAYFTIILPPPPPKKKHGFTLFELISVSVVMKGT